MKDPLRILQEAIEDEQRILRRYERPSEALTLETLRALDYAHCRELIPELKRIDDSGRQKESICRRSVNAALKRVLPVELHAENPRLFASSAATAKQADEFLFRTGCLTMAEQQLSLLRSGALEARIDKRKVMGMKLLVLSVRDAGAYREQIGFQGQSWLSETARAGDRSKEEALERRHMQVLPRLTDYLRGNPSPGDLPFDDVDNYFNEWAVLYLRRMSFTDMLAEDDRFGGRPFADYVAVLVALSALSQQRFCYAALLNADRPNVGIRNFLTGCSIYEELLEAIAGRLGAEEREVSEILDHLMLSPGNAAANLNIGTPALAPVVRTSRQLVVLPMYGLELNPFVFLWTELRRRYEKDWFEAANRREARWVAQLHAQFPAPRWQCLDGVKLKREGKTLTDIDFAAHDTLSSSVMLFQLKWQQPFVSDDRLRRNNASNLVQDSNKWVSDVSGWLAAVGSKGLKERLSIKNGTDLSVYFVVLGRYHAHFTSAEPHDPRAVWCDWGNFLSLRLQQANASSDEFITALRILVEQAIAAVNPESFFIPLEKIMVLVNPVTVPHHSAFDRQ